jgi:hypothetical protein
LVFEYSKNGRFDLGVSKYLTINNSKVIIDINEIPSIIRLSENPESVPGKPKNFYFSKYNDDEVQFFWNLENEYATKISVERKESDSEQFEIIDEVDPFQTQYIDDRVAENTQYEYRLKSENNVSASGYTLTKKIKTAKDNLKLINVYKVDFRPGDDPTPKRNDWNYYDGLINPLVIKASDRGSDLILEVLGPGDGSKWTSFQNLGKIEGHDKGMMIDDVLRLFVYSNHEDGNPAKFKISGLKDSIYYTYKIACSRNYATQPQWIKISLDKYEIAVNAANNIDNLVTFHTFEGKNGSFEISLQPILGNTASFLNGLIIEEYVLDPNAELKGVLMKVYPNPAREKLKLEIQNQEEGEYFVELYNSKGQIVLKEKVQLKNEIDELVFYDLNLSYGTYFFNLVKNNNIMATTKCVINN